MQNRHASKRSNNDTLEKEFIDSIGTGEHYDWSKHKEVPSRLELLKSYNTALKKRTDWKGLSKVEIRAYLADAILKEKRN